MKYDKTKWMKMHIIYLALKKIVFIFLLNYKLKICLFYQIQSWLQNDKPNLKIYIIMVKIINKTIYWNNKCK